MKFNNKNVQISPKARLGRNVRIGDNTIIYDNVEIGDNAVICNDCIIGEPQNRYYRDSAYENPFTRIGSDSLIRSHCIVYAGCVLGRAFSCGHWITIRENSIIGDYCTLGTLSDLEGEVRIGNYCRLHSNVHVSQTSIIGDYVWMYPYSVMTNDPYPPSNDIMGAKIGDYSVIGVHAVILPGIKVGHNCLIGAGSVVNKNLKDFSFANGSPLKILDLRNYVVMGKGKPYPWMKHFGRGMPWEKMGFDAWENQKLPK